MKNRLIVDIYWCASSETWCCKTFTIIHAQNIVVQKIFVRAEGPLQRCWLITEPDSERLGCVLFQMVGPDQTYILTW